MESGNMGVDVRPARAVRLVEHGDVVVAYPEPHRTPVLPRGWAPLTREQMLAVLRACDGAPDAVSLRIGSLWDPDYEYRVYRLSVEQWAGMWVASRCLVHSAPPAGAEALEPGNRQLLGLTTDAMHAIAIAVDFFNWDLEVQGHAWRLGVTKAEFEG